LPSVPKIRIVTLNKEEILRLLNAVDRNTSLGARNYAIILLLLDTGMRISELVSVNLANLELTKGYIKIRGKGQKEREVPFSGTIRRELKRYIQRYRPVLGNVGSGYLFTKIDGEHISVCCIQQALRRIARKAGINPAKCHPHIFRHTFATMFAVKGGPSAILQEIMGHESFQTTQKYLHPQPEDLKRQHIKYSPVTDIFGEWT